MMKVLKFFLLCLISQVCFPMVMASDHADPIDPLNRERLEGGITDLFVFPVDSSDQPVKPWLRVLNVPLANPLADILREPLKDEDIQRIDSLVFILCVRRQLTESGSLLLEPYSYRILLDLDSQIEFPTPEDFKRESEARAPMPGEPGYGSSSSGTDQPRPTLVESFARYGGKITNPAEIQEDLVMEFRLDNNARLQPDYPKFSGAAAAGWESHVSTVSGIFDDPFIFPAFFGTNVVAMAVKVPIKLLPSRRHNFLIWATSHKGDRQVDHVGRSLRTQNPRFEILNTLHPKLHEQAIRQENKNPSLMRDIGLRLNLGQVFAYRKWDFVPDVMCYSTRYPVGYPNGRLLTDDVGALLAQHGDTLLYEISYQHPNGSWPRQTVNDMSFDPKVPGSFNPKFPYLHKPHPDKKASPPLRLSKASIWKLVGIAFVLILLLALENLVVAKIYHRIKIRKRYL